MPDTDPLRDLVDADWRFVHVEDDIPAYKCDSTELWYSVKFLDEHWFAIVDAAPEDDDRFVRHGALASSPTSALEKFLDSHGDEIREVFGTIHPAEL